MVDFPAYKIDSRSVYTPDRRTLEAPFGDGYSQNVNDGINSLNEEWAMKFSHRPKADIAAIKTFLDTVGKVTPFYWTAPIDTVAKLWRLDSSYPITDAEAGTMSISFTIKRFYGAA